MNNSFFKLLRTACLLAGIAFPISASAQDASGIKTANLKDADLKLMNNHDPASQLENFELLPGYQVNLFASNPMLANPVHMHWDSKGRLWVACSWAYPQLKPGEVANDKIIILEDTDNDGAADKSTVFADGLYLPTGLELANGGCYVAQSPDVFFLKDTDGDDVADVKKVVLTGFGIEDSHHSISAWRRGPGGWIYFQEGIFLHTQVETPHGVVRNFNGGVYQFNPRTLKLRMFCTGTGGNPWGHVFDRWGQSFMVNNPRILHLSPWTGNSGEKLQVKPLISTEKQCGGDLATGSHVGDDIRGQLLTGRFKSRTVVRYEFIDNGASFSANVLEPLISSKHPNFRPVDVKVGPDGAVYVADWYNSIINHAQHDFRDPRRDHSHGRIWRITHKERPLTKKPKLVGVSIEALVNHLKSPEDWARHQARKELSERDGDEVLAALEAWVKKLDVDAADYDHHLVEAMWACQNVERHSENILKRVLNAKDGHARSAGARMIRYWHENLSDPIALIAVAAGDSYPRTRMEAVLSAGYVPHADAFVAALQAVDHPRDAALELALGQTMKTLESHWRGEMDAGNLKFAKPSHRAFAEREAGIGLERRLAIFLRAISPSEKEIASIRALVLGSGTNTEIRMIVNALSTGQGLKSPQATIAMLEALNRIAAGNEAKATRRSIRGLIKLLDHENESIAVLAARNLGAWKIAGTNEVAAIRDGSHSLPVRQTLAVALARTHSTRYGRHLADLATKGDLETQYAAVVGLAHADLERGAKAAAQLLAKDPQGADPIPVVQAMLQQRKGGRVLSESLKDVDVHPTVIARVGKFHRDTGLLPDGLIGKFQPTTKVASLGAKLLAEDAGLLTADVDKLGDPARGEQIFRRKNVACTQCHAVGSAGPVIGPNLVAVGGAAKTKYLVESILQPNVAIAEHYETKMFLLESGTVQTGIVTFRNDKEIVVRDSAQFGKEVRLAVEDVEEEQPAKSLMPAGLADQLQNRGEFLDLVKFISVLGKPGAYANDESPVIRKWRVIAGTDNGRLPKDDASWEPAYSQVNGNLPLERLDQAGVVFAKGFVNVQVAGKVSLDINQTNGLRLWIDGLEVDDLSAAIELSQGRKEFTFAIDRGQSRANAGLRVELKTPDKSSAKFQVEGGM